MSDLEPFLEKWQDDSGMRARCRAKLFDALVAMAADEGFTFTSEEFAEFSKGITLHDIVALRKT
jgi:hypothetical protein